MNVSGEGLGVVVTDSNQQIKCTGVNMLCYSKKNNFRERTDIEHFYFSIRTAALNCFEVIMAWSCVILLTAPIALTLKPLYITAI